jgi:hypothetical protein
MQSTNATGKTKDAPFLCRGTEDNDEDEEDAGYQDL